MKTIIFGNNSFRTHKRGVENVILNHLELYNNSQVYYFHWGNKNEIYKYQNLVCCSIKNNYFWPVYLNILLFRLSKIDYIHSHNPLFTFISFFNTDIFTLHDGLYYLAKFNRNKKAILLNFIERLIYFRVKKIHFISNFSKQKSLFKNNKPFKIIFNSSFFETITISDTNVFERRNYILIVKSIEERSRIDLLIDVAQEMKDKYFVIAGKGPLLNYYKDIIKTKGIANLNMLGYVSDSLLAELYRKSSCVINLAEFGEGFGLPIIEAYYFNKPVIGSNCCAIPEVIISDNFLVENNKSSIVRKLNELEFSDNFNFKDYYDEVFSKKKMLAKLKDFADE